MKFINKTMKGDKVQAYRSEDGFYSISKRPGENWITREYSMFNILGTVIDESETLEEALEMFEQEYRTLSAN